MPAKKPKKKHPLARWRAIDGLTQKQLADKADVHPTTIARIETAGQIPTVDVAVRISTALGGKVEWIWGDAEQVELMLDMTEFARDQPDLIPELGYEWFKAGYLDSLQETRVQLGLPPLKRKRRRPKWMPNS